MQIQWLHIFWTDFIDEVKPFEMYEFAIIYLEV